MHDDLHPNTWQRVSALFDTGRDLAPGERAAWLDQLERDEPQVAPWLRRMLQAHAEPQTADWLARGPQWPAGSAPEAATGLAPGGRIGPWRLLRPLGQGGMATVWLAERADGAYQREVALKLPLMWQLGGGTAERFARERGIVAALEHPHIARLYDAGSSPEGLPWLAMERVDGTAIDAHADAAGLGLRERVALLMQVLDAVQYAHTRLVIHRDLKPANVLVDAQGGVKLLDFGIARLLADADAPAATEELTRAGQRLFTPAYAAPEQLRGQALSTATDIYAAGVLLFRLLTGRLPYAGAADTPGQIEHAMAQGQLLRASQAAIGKPWARQLRGDLDAIASQALQAEPARRYATAAAMADDLRRWLAQEPVLARPESLAYRSRKFVARNRLAVGAAVLAGTALLAGLGAALWQAEKAARERDRALEARLQAEAVNFFLNDLLVEAARDDKPVTVPDLLRRGEAMARASLAQQPANLGMVLSIIGNHRAEVDTPQAGRQLLGEALALIQDEELRRDIECEDASWQGRLGEVDTAMQRLARIGGDAAVRPITRAICLGYLADFQQDKGDAALALATTQAALAQWQASRERWAQHELSLRNRLGSRLSALGRVAEAEEQFGLALVRIEQLGQGRGMAGIGLRNQWGFLSFGAGDAAHARQMYERNLQVFAQDKKDGPPPAVFIYNAGAATLEWGDAAAAATLLQRAWQVADATQDQPMRLRARCLGAVASLRSGQAATAQQWVRDAAAITAPASPPGELARVQCALAQAELALAEGRPQAALEGLHALLQRPLAQAHTQVAALTLRAQAALAAGQAQAAAADAAQALQRARALQAAKPHSTRTGQAALVAAQAAQALGQPAAAAEHAALAASQLAAALAPGHAATAQAQALAATSARP